MSYRALGTVDDDRAAYVAWSNAVRANGGSVTNFPFHTVSSGAIMGDPYGLPAARYPVDVVYPTDRYGALAPLFNHAPDGWTADNSAVYYLAPIEAQRYANSGDVTAPQSVPGETPPPNPNWYDSLETVVKATPWVLGGAVALYLLSFLPRPRNG